MRGDSVASLSLQDVVELETQELPAWDAFDRHVLRFSGYFKESVVEANLENHRASADFGRSPCFRSFRR